MKHLATLAALVAIFALPTIASGIDLTQTVPQGTIDVECATWQYENDEPFSGVNIGGVGRIGPVIGKATNEDVVLALGAVEDAVLDVEKAINDIEFPTVRSMTCVEWQEFVAR